MKLIEPSTVSYPSYLEAIREYASTSACPFLNPERYNVFERIDHFRTGQGLPSGYVKATYLWLVEGDEFIGEISIRHSLTDALLRYGGHIGYGVRRSKWNQGFGTKMLSMALDYARDHFDFDKVLITCDDDNIGSARVIEKNGGILQDKISNEIGGKTILTRRYWIML